MTVRTFKQLAQAYSTNANIQVLAKINGVEVFNGNVAAINSPIPTTLEESQAVAGALLFTWTADVLFEGTATMEIAVSGGNLLLKNTYANYSYAFGGPPIERYDGITGGESAFLPMYVFEYEGLLIRDPLSNVAFNGTAQTKSRIYNNNVLAGQLGWEILDQTNFTATVNILAGSPPA
jgi:hypothetical protein